MNKPLFWVKYDTIQLQSICEKGVIVMKFLHVRSLRTIFLAAAVCVLGFFFAYLSMGMRENSNPSTSATTSPLPTLDLEIKNESDSPLEEQETPSEDSETPNEEPSADHTSNAVANYYIRLTRGLSSSDSELQLELPIELKASVEYRGKDNNVTFREESDIAAVLGLLQKAQRLPDDTTIISISSSHDVTLTLPYSDGYGNLYIFEGYPDGSKKAVTLIQDNSNHLYQTKSAVAERLYDLLKPVESSLDAERLNIYSSRNYSKSILQAQSINKKDYDLIVDILNSLEKCGSSLDLDDPDYLITLLPSNSVSEKDYCFLWMDEKELKIAFADDSFTVYRSTDVTSAQMKKWIKSNSVK